MLVYREPTREAAGSAAKHALLSAVRRLERDPIGDCAVEALLRAAEIECALADLGHSSVGAAAVVTDALAAHVLVDNGPPLQQVERNVRGLELPHALRFSTPAGYGYHALDPRQYAALAESLAEPGTDAPIAVIGIRSIGVSLGAVVSEALRARGCTAARTTVRPTGHPWARTLQLSEAESRFVEVMRAQGARFAVVDEGPYASGSTFLAVAEALERAGVARTAITLLASHEPDPQRLLAKAAAERWRRYACLAITPWTRLRDGEDISSGRWRKLAYGEDATTWPACWVQLERVKRLSPDGAWLDKFEGLAPYLESPFERACALAQAGYAPSPTWLGHGFVRYPWLPGRPARTSDLGAQGLRELARYCAYRAREFATDDVDAEALVRMTRRNLDEAFGVDLGDRVRFEVERPIVPDARMQPHEWCVTAGGKWMKIDGHAHGDGPLLPGPADVCWDLAGAIVEWNMDDAQRERFVSDYTRLAGDRPETRLPAYLIGYCAQRLGETYIATATADPTEQLRLRAEYDRYRAQLERWFDGAARKARARQRRLTREYARPKHAA